jgi:hypothetical protein
MTLLPAPLLRGLTLLAIGGALAVGHATFATAASPKPVRVAASASTADVTATGSIGADGDLAENCWVEVVREKTAGGRTVARRVHECD